MRISGFQKLNAEATVICKRHVLVLQLCAQAPKRVGGSRVSLPEHGGYFSLMFPDGLWSLWLRDRDAVAGSSVPCSGCMLQDQWCAHAADAVPVDTGSGATIHVEIEGELRMYRWEHSVNWPPGYQPLPREHMCRMCTVCRGLFLLLCST